MAVDLGTPQDWQQGAGALKNGIDAIRSVVEMLKPFGSGGKKPTPDEQALIDKAVAEAEKAAKVADAQTAKALGYTLCHCQFPPVAMLTVGFWNFGEREGEPVHECPSCGRPTSGPYDFHRTVPERPKASP